MSIAVNPTMTADDPGQIEPRPPPSSQSLGQDDFMTLMMAQLKAQDPMNPMDSHNFLSQLAQFSTVSGIEKLNQSFVGLAESLTSSQTLQASQLVGRSVLVQGEGLVFDGTSGAVGAIDLPVMVPDLTINLYDATGQLVRTMSMAGQGPGLVNINWDGLDDSGEPLPAGRYRQEATGSINGEQVVFESMVRQQVDGVSVDAQGGPVLLSLAGGQQITLDQVREIR
ncbi:flagellar hook assembly protein FlgD [Thioalkalicoccus limnaeus]|uniref:Basal-body rod modification protein FlgD n=1 Tax=Thioalkalicoccus limnaeus TaxID=120681 RepID=A0ABV4BDI9_9GAMM